MLRSELQGVKEVLRLLAIPCVLLFLAVSSQHAPAHAAISTASQQSHNANTQGGCYVLAIHLHGKAALTQNCVAKTEADAAGMPHHAFMRNASTNSTIRPYSSVQTICNDPDVDYYEDANSQGRQLCVDGTGRLDLTTIWIVWPFQNWANRISSVNINYGVSTNLFPNTGCTGAAYDGTYNFINTPANVPGSWNDSSRCVTIF